MSGLVDAFDGSGATTFRPVPSWGGKALDQFLVTPGVEVEARVTLTEDTVALAGGRTAYLSDHYGIEAVVRG